MNNAILMLRISTVAIVVLILVLGIITALWIRADFLKKDVEEQLSIAEKSRELAEKRLEIARDAARGGRGNGKSPMILSENLQDAGFVEGALFANYDKVICNGLNCYGVLCYISHLKAGRKKIRKATAKEFYDLMVGEYEPYIDGEIAREIAEKFGVEVKN